MKRLNLYFIFVLIGLAFSSCLSEDEEYQDPITDLSDKGGLVKANFESSIIDFSEIQPSSTVVMDLIPTDARGNDGELIESAEIYVQYSSPASNNDTTTNFELIRTQPNAIGNISITVEEIVALFPVVSFEELIGGDAFTFRFHVNMTDGRVFTPDNTAPAICGTAEARGTCFQTVSLVCPTDIPAGEYTSVIESAGFGIPASPGIDVSIVKTGLVDYSITDVTAGMVGILIGDPSYVATGGSVRDICNDIQVVTYSPPGIVPVSQSSNAQGVYDPATNIIVIEWSIVGTDCRTTLTPK